MTEAAERVRNIARDLRVFARPDDEATGAVDIHRVIDSSVRMAWNEIRHRARLVRSLGTPPSVRANEGRLGQVFLNLLLNAADAMGGRGRVTVSAGPAPAAADTLEIRVADTGPGIPAEHLGRVFEPFFTTKPPGQGTGLGLAVCHGIVASFGGAISAANGAAGGAELRLALRRWTA
jgi:C4-dicarboxylate-specific signal transduction histidine kinase